MTMLMSLREHKTYTAYNPDVIFQKYNPTTVEVYTTTGSIGCGYVFKPFDRAWFHFKRIRVTWSFAGYSGMSCFIRLYDGEYDRSSDTDFPEGSDPTPKGNGLLATLRTNTGAFSETWTSGRISTAGGNQTMVTLFFTVADGWSAQWGQMRIDKLEILGTTWTN